MDLNELRVRIDGVDDRILELLEERAGLVEEVAASKRAAQVESYHDPERERLILERLEAKGAGRFPREAIRAVFREVLSACLALQAPPRVAFLGPEGTFSHMAARCLFGLGAVYRETNSIEGVFDAVARRDATYGVVPVENSTEGAVTLTLDALLESDLRIRQELVLDVSHCLLSRAPGLPSIERVYSHPQALGQCRSWLARNLAGAQLVHAASTAAAARAVLDDPRGAAIATRLSGELYGLPVLTEKIQDHPENATRFVVVGPTERRRTGRDKTTLAFSLRDELGALRRVLEVFDEAGINLTRIESRPSRQKAWDYVFLCDLIGHHDDENVASAVDVLQSRCAMVKVLGSYPRHEPSPEGS
jgi:chorismate mutase/prephenate dehydratase